MLPDFPWLKKRLHEKLYEFFLDRTDQYLGVVGRIPKHRRKEGGPGQLLIRHDGSTDASRAVELAVPFALEGDEIESITMDQLLAKVDRAALEMARKQWG